MTTADAIRFLDHQAMQCRGRDAGEALCLLLPAFMEILGLDRMEDLEAGAFRHGFKRDLEALARPLGRVLAQDKRITPSYDTTKDLSRSDRPAHVAARSIARDPTRPETATAAL